MHNNPSVTSPRELFTKENQPLILNKPKSPLRYPGGKSKAVNSILPFIPKDTKKICSPFLGGGIFRTSMYFNGYRSIWFRFI